MIFTESKRDRKIRERKKEGERACVRASNFSGFVNLLTQQKKWLMGTARSDMIYDSIFKLSANTGL